MTKAIEANSKELTIMTKAIEANSKEIQNKKFSLLGNKNNKLKKRCAIIALLTIFVEFVRKRRKQYFIYMLNEFI